MTGVERASEAYEVEPDGMEDLIKSVHAAIRADPTPAPKKSFTPDKSFKKPGKMTYEQRQERNKAKKAARLVELQEKAAAGGAGGDDDEEDEE